jgi:hypothetical protein
MYDTLKCVWKDCDPQSMAQDTELTLQQPTTRRVNLVAAYLRKSANRLCRKSYRSDYLLAGNRNKVCTACQNTFFSEVHPKLQQATKFSPHLFQLARAIADSSMPLDADICHYRYAAQF